MKITSRSLFLLGGATTLIGFGVLPWIFVLARLSGYQLIQFGQMFSRGSNVPMTLLWAIPVAGLFSIATGLYVHPARLLGVISILLSLVSLFVAWNAMKDIINSGGVDYGFWVTLAGLLMIGIAGIMTFQRKTEVENPPASSPVEMPEGANLRAQFEATRALIDSKQYSAARNLLKTIDHPKAGEWLARLEKMQ